MKSSRDCMALITTVHLFAQHKTHVVKQSGNGIGVTAINAGELNGLLLLLEDISVKLYPGNFKEWKTGIKLSARKLFLF